MTDAITTTRPPVSGEPSGTFPIVDVTTWPVGDEPERMGTRGKDWLIEPDTSPEIPWLFKAIRCKELTAGHRCFDEDWAELLATEAAGSLGLPAATVHLAARDGERGVISRSLLVGPDGHPVAEALDHGNELLQARNPRYDKSQVREAVGYTLDAVWEALAGVDAPSGCRAPLETATDVFAGYLLLDALVAGTDRHHENWAVLRRGVERWLAPTYDHGTCLGFQVADEDRVRYFEGRGSSSMDIWVRRGQSNHFEGRPNLVELAQDGLLRVSDEVARHWRAQLASFDLDGWWDTVERVPATRMSHPARRFAFEVVRLNRERLLE